jgi:hypothetical protein
MYPALVTLSLILVFGSSAYMSISGLLSIFSNNPIIIICMGLGMEIGKILTVSHIYRTWQNDGVLIKFVFVLIVFILTTLTSFEVVGFLSQSHQKTFQGNYAIQSKIDALNNEESILKSQIEMIDITLKGLPDTHVTRRIQERKNYGYAVKQNKLIEIINERAKLEARLISSDDNLNPISSISKILKVDDSIVISIFIPFIVLILEPLSIGLTIAANAAWLNYYKDHNSAPSIDRHNIINSTEMFKTLLSKHNLTISEVAKITGRKKLKTCESWIDGTIPTPPRVMAKIQTWIEKQKSFQKPIRSIQQGGE